MATSLAALVAAIYDVGPAPTLLAARLRMTPEGVKIAIARNTTASTLYTERVREVWQMIPIFGVNLSAMAKYFGASRAQVKAWLAENKVLREAWDGATGALFDQAQQNLLEALQRGDWRATELMLLKSGEGRSAGYGERLAVSLEQEALALGVDLRAAVDALTSTLLAGEGQQPQLGSVDAEAVEGTRVDEPVAIQAPADHVDGPAAV